MKSLIKIFLGTAFFFTSTASSYSQYTLDQTLGAPYVQSIYASMDGSSLAWVTNEKGVRNIWYTDAANVDPQKLTAYTDDDGLNVSVVMVSSEYLVFVLGNGNNRQGQPANPASLPETPVRQMIRLKLADKSMDTLDAVGGAVPDPQGKRLIYSKSGSVQIIDDITIEDPKPRSLFSVRSGAGSLTWSPDGNSVAFVSNRDDHSFVGVYLIPEKKVRWMAPAFSYDEIPAWSPDGRQLTFIRRDGRNRDQLFNLTGGYEFEVMVADVSSGKARSIWKSPGDDGGFAQYYSNAPLRWTKGNKILFHSEHDGWNHIYSISPDGSGLKDLTPGTCEVENSTLSIDHQLLYVSTNCGDINRRHIWQVTVTTGTSNMITDQGGIQTHPVALSNGAIAYREGTYNKPTSVVLKKGSTMQNLVTLPSNHPADQLREPEAVTFKAADGLIIHGQLFLPAKKSKEKLPAVIFMHGGPIRQMLLGYHYSGYYANAYTLNQYMSSLGYVVLSVNFRDGIGYGRDFRRAEKQGPRGASEYKDIVAAGKYLQSRPEVDPEKVGLWGGSYGGYLTAMGLAKDSDLFKAGVDFHGVHDWAWRGRDFSPGGGWGLTEETMEMAYQSSPISELQFWSSPVLIITGDDDRNVMFGQSIDLKNKLDDLGIYNEVLVFPDEVHGFLRYESWLKAYEATVDFFDRFLK